MAIHQDEEVNTFLPWFPLKTLEDAKAFFLERYEAVYRQPRGYSYAICLKPDRTPIGYIGVSMADSHDFGYGLRRDHWRRGIITEAGQAIIARVKQDGLPFITATHDVNNPRSGKVMQRLGMAYRYSYQEQWQPKDFPVIFRMYQLNLDGQADRVYRKYWDISSLRFVEEGV